MILFRREITPYQDHPTGNIFVIEVRLMDSELGGERQEAVDLSISSGIFGDLEQADKLHHALGEAIRIARIEREKRGIPRNGAKYTKLPEPPIPPQTSQQVTRSTRRGREGVTLTDRQLELLKLLSAGHSLDVTYFFGQGDHVSFRVWIDSPHPGKSFRFDGRAVNGLIKRKLIGRVSTVYKPGRREEVYQITERGRETYGNFTPSETSPES